ncbi:hypothetical protein [Agrobacterium rosae]|uniref:Uncharacterized protein n=1 Tax=Agrobacterium rosae TaxID=1972867 RepID=A0AAW9FIM0_9HYPH|nr:hypothetical protein [Agrobacterium rosae]MDX8305541.1 hypothetical protein [Agrobacterium rosae]
MTIHAGLPGRYLIHSGEINVSPQARDATDADWRQISTWRQFHQVSEMTPVQIVSFAGDCLHCGSLRQWLHGIRDELRGKSLAILYLYCGHQLDTRSPILQHLLNQLDICQSAFALRIEDDNARRDALSMASALLHAHDHVLLLHDDLNRIAERGTVSGSLKYALFAKGSDLFAPHPLSGMPGYAPWQGNLAQEACL